jgi:predicted MPP superfamily phosphohydrolase
MFRILHLSDLHARTDQRWSTAPLLLEAKKILLAEANDQNIDVLAFTGDIAYSGKREEYDIAAEWIEGFCLSSSGLNLDCSRVLFVPGNHDVDRSLITKSAQAIEQKLRSATSISGAAECLDASDITDNLLARHKAYSDFCMRIRGDATLSLPSWTHSIDSPGQKIVFEGFCSSALSSGDNDRGNLIIGQPQITEVVTRRPDADILIALVHHPLSYLKDFDLEAFEDHLRSNHSLLLRGHLHRHDSVYRQGANGSYLELATGSLHDTIERPNSFSIIDLADDLQSVSIRVFTWSRNRWVRDRNEFSDMPDGIGVFPLRAKKSSASSSAAPFVFTQGVPADEQPSFPRVNLLEPSEESNPSAIEAIAHFPRFRHIARPQDVAIRAHLQEQAVHSAIHQRLLEIQSEWGADHFGFLASFFVRWKQERSDLTLLHARCGGAANGKQLQEAVAIAGDTTIPELFTNLRHCGNCVLLLDDVGASTFGEGKRFNFVANFPRNGIRVLS